MKKFLMKRRAMGALASVALIGALVVAPNVSSAARLTPHVTSGTCVATGAGTPAINGAVSLTMRKAGAPSNCSVTLQGHWAANSSVFSTAYAGDTTVSATGAWTAAIASPQLRGTVSGSVPVSSTGGATGGSSSLYFSINCVITYSPFSIRCTIYIGNSNL